MARSLVPILRCPADQQLWRFLAQAAQLHRPASCLLAPRCRRLLSPVDGRAAVKHDSMSYLAPPPCCRHNDVHVATIIRNTYDDVYDRTPYVLDLVPSSTCAIANVQKITDCQCRFNDGDVVSLLPFSGGDPLLFVSKFVRIV